MSQKTKERPIIFRAEMVRAILDGRKSQTRRLLKGSTEFNGPYNHLYLEVHKDCDGWRNICHYGKPCDRLWVKEKFAVQPSLWKKSHDEQPIHYLADCEMQEIEDYVVKSPIYMPRWASRLILEIINVRIERLQDISEEDAKAEGAIELEKFYDKKGNNLGWNNYSFESENCSHNAVTAKEAFSIFWDYINGQNSWQQNPWVWVIEFKRVNTEVVR